MKKFILTILLCLTPICYANNTLTKIDGVKVGHYTHPLGNRGVTVVMFHGFNPTAAVDVRGGAPGTRETDLLDPMNLVDRVDAILLAGGSAYGLNAANGIMDYLAEKGQGFPINDDIVVPIVPGAVIFDLLSESHTNLPKPQWGYEAALYADSKPVKQGRVGAGSGATVGKVNGMNSAMPGGVGSSIINLGDDIYVGAIVVVNAFGDVIEPNTQKIIAGAMHEGEFLNTESVLLKETKNDLKFAGSNTTIGVVVTNANLNKTQLKKVAQLAQNGLAKSIKPVHTMFDGDTIFAVSTREHRQDMISVTRIGIAADKAIQEAVVNAVSLDASIVLTGKQ